MKVLTTNLMSPDFSENSTIWPKWPTLDERAWSTPSIIIFLDRVEANVQQMIRLAGGAERLRPHVKTHKLQPLVERQIAAGITKFKAATLAEVEMCARAGAADVMLAYPPLGPVATGLACLAHEYPAVKFSATIDSSESLLALAQAAAAADVTLGVWLDMDVGMHRTGIAPGPLALDLYRQAGNSASLQARGFHAYDGHIHESDPTARAQHWQQAHESLWTFFDEVRFRGLPTLDLVLGGSPTFSLAATVPSAQCSPGTTVLWDFGYAEKYPDLPFIPAAFLLTRVISRSRADEATLDLGHKAVAAEKEPPRLRVQEAPDAVYPTHSEEHLIIRTAAANRWRPGQVLHALPRHICPTMALYDEVYAFSPDHRLIEIWPLTARTRKLADFSPQAEGT